jgi:ankyrin repeat protein
MDAMDERDPFHGERLHFAAQDGDLGQVRRLLSEGLDINAFDDLGKTPLHYAVEKERFEVAQYLIEHGADVNARHEPSAGNTPLAEIAGNCSLRIAKLLVDSGADPTIPGWMQLNALHRAEKRKRGDGPGVYELLVRASKKGRP